VFLKLWYAEYRLHAQVRQVVNGGPQTVSEENVLQKLKE
jgi:hypothetical protein